MNVTCLILNYNDPVTTESLVHSIHDFQSLQHILIVDNCSTDGSYERLKTLEDEKVTVIQADYNGGYGYGNNYGIRYASEHFKSDFVLICNPDVEFEESLVKNLTEAFSHNPDASVISTIAMKPDGTRQHDTGWKLPTVLSYTLSASIIATKVLKLDQYPSDYFMGEGLREVGCVPGSLLMVRTKDMLQYGMYDEKMFLYCEETTLGYKLHKHRRKTYVLLGDQFVHHHSVSINKSISSMMKQRKLMNDNKYYFIRTYLTDKKWKLFLSQVFFKLASWENRIIFKIKGV